MSPRSYTDEQRVRRNERDAARIEALPAKARATYSAGRAAKQQRRRAARRLELGVGLLVRDRRPDRADGVLVQRRRADCANLRACEVAWSTQPRQRVGHAQARCPAACGGYAARAT